jgi:periplasmic divalent cation tolerance protein
MTAFIQIATTTSTKEEAQQIAHKLVELRLAACAQVTGPVTSVYRWEDKIEQAEEWLCTIKTRGSLFAKVAAAIREIHSYQCPEIVATPIVEASDDYLAWLDRELA